MLLSDLKPSLSIVGADSNVSVSENASIDDAVLPPGELVDRLEASA